MEAVSAAQEGKASACDDMSVANVSPASAFGLVSSSTSDRKDELQIDRFVVTISDQLKDAVDRSFERFKQSVSGLSIEALKQKEGDLRKEIESSFADGSWRSRLPGREILKRFVQSEKIPTNYESFRNQIVTAMTAQNFKPAGMKTIVDKILSGQDASSNRSRRNVAPA